MLILTRIFVNTLKNTTPRSDLDNITTKNEKRKDLLASFEATCVVPIIVENTFGTHRVKEITSTKKIVIFVISQPHIYDVHKITST